MKETICWTCKNCTKCSWSKGIPVEGWKAEKTVVHVSKTCSYGSYLVKKCPEYIQDDKIKVTDSNLAKLLNITFNNFRNTSLAEIRRLLSEKGYKLYIIQKERYIKKN